MDKNSFIGIALIIGIFLTFSILNKPSEEEIEKQRLETKHYNDSVDNVIDLEEFKKEAEEKEAEEIAVLPQAALDSLKKEKALAENSKLAKKFDLFVSSAVGTKEYFTLENDELILKISSKGGNVVSAKLKKYQNYQNYMIAKDSLKDVKAEDLPILEPLQLFDEDSTTQFFNLELINSKDIKTSDLYFEKVFGNDEKIVLRAKTTDANKYLEISYNLKENYDVDYKFNLIGLEDDVEGEGIMFNWEMRNFLTEKEYEGPSRMSTIFYKPKNSGRTYLSEMSEQSEDLESKSTWIAFKHSYFSSVVISEDGFQKGGSVYSNPVKKGRYSHHYRTELNLSTDLDSRTTIPLTFFYGPNDYDILESHGHELVDIIDLGWGIFRWTAKWLIKPIFDFLNGFGLAMGIIILLLTIIVRLIILPLTYKNYKSSAKMKVLKPEITALNEKFKDGDAVKKQQATMALYRQTGVNPMAGCLPMFIQMPILLAVFRFFPSSLELRQKSFLWAEDLSTYESVLDLPFHIPAYGTHVSLFTILLTVSTIFYTKMNSSQMNMGGQPGMPNMKVIMYLMPLMMLFFLNNYAAGLTFYYFCGNLITMGLMLFVKKYMIDENKIRLAIEANKKKPKKKSNFRQRMDIAMEQSKQKQANKKKKKKK